MKNEKYKEKFQGVYEKHKNHHTTDGYDLAHISEIYFPFWTCKQSVIMQQVVKTDKLSEILLSLVNEGVKKHIDICHFLGISEKDFILIHLHFLIKNKFLEDTNGSYEITFDGRNFLKKDFKELETMEKKEIEYIVSDLEIDSPNNKIQFLYKQKENINYKYYQTHKINNTTIKHSNSPTINKIDKSDFVNFVNENIEGSFYDYSKLSIETHKRSILFLLLVFKNIDEEVKIEIRHCKDSVEEFYGHRLEERFSEEVKRYYDKHPSKIQELIKQPNYI